jgi:hypothetical protein
MNENLQIMSLHLPSIDLHESSRVELNKIFFESSRVELGFSSRVESSWLRARDFSSRVESSQIFFESSRVESVFSLVNVLWGGVAGVF